MNSNAAPRQRIVSIAVCAIFLLFGCAFMVGTVLYPFLQSRAAREWKETPCRILSSEVKSHSDSDGTTYSVEISYAYKEGEQEFRSSRYQFLRFSSSGRQAKAAVVARYPRGKQTVCYVNPNDPAAAVLDRNFASIGWFALIPLAFMGVGTAGIVSVIRGRKDSEAEVSWQSRPDWVAGKIASSAKKTLAFAWSFTVAWNAIAFPVAWSVLSQHVIQKGNYAAALALLFPLIGVGLFCWALRELLRWVRFGNSVFEMASVPGVLGKTLEGVIRLNRPLRTEEPVRLWIKCVSKFTVNDGDGRSSKEALVWQREATAAVADLGYTIPVAFPIPGDASPTTVIRSGDGILWRLEVKARMPLIDYVAQFEVPVFDPLSK